MSGDKEMKKGESALKSWKSVFSSMEQSAKDHFERAAVQYKSTAEYAKAAKAYCRAAEMQRKLLAKEKDQNTEELSLGMLYESAGSMYGNAAEEQDEKHERGEAEPGQRGEEDYHSLAKQAYTEAGEAYLRGGKLARAAQCFEEAGNVARDAQEKKELYMRSCSTYQEHGSKVHAARLLQRMALYEAKTYNFEKAMALFDQLGRDQLDDVVTRSGAFRVLFLALVANLALLGGHQEPATDNCNPTEILRSLKGRFELYQRMDTQFNKNCQEFLFIVAVIEAVEQSDVEAYDAAVKKFHRICPMEAPVQMMVSEGRKGIAAGSSIL